MARTEPLQFFNNLAVPVCREQAFQILYLTFQVPADIRVADQQPVMHPLHDREFRMDVILLHDRRLGRLKRLMRHHWCRS